MKTILIVDDSRTFQRVMEKILTPHYQILGKGSSGAEGFELYQSLRPDLVLMDITMPNCDGKECLQKIMAIDPNAKVIMVSGIGDEQTVQECLQLGAKAFVRKADISQSNTEASALAQTVGKVVMDQVSREVA